MKTYSARCHRPVIVHRVILGIIVTGIRIYQRAISPLLGPHCRFYPTCSEYAVQAMTRHGLINGIILGIKRLLRCHPFHPGGVDPVP